MQYFRIVLYLRTEGDRKYSETLLFYSILGSLKIKVCHTMTKGHLSLTKNSDTQQETSPNSIGSNTELKAFHSFILC